jgi:hypothetical protein
MDFGSPVATSVIALAVAVTLAIAAFVLYTVYFARGGVPGAGAGAGAEGGELLEENKALKARNESLRREADELRTAASYLQPQSTFTQPAQGPALPVNVPTRGEPEQYRPVGLLSFKNKGEPGSAAAGSDDGAQDRDRVIQLIGRRTYPGSDDWNYYLTLPGGGLRVPLEIEGRECEKSRGCDELYDGDSVYIAQLDATYEASMYNETPIRYIPVRD